MVGRGRAGLPGLLFKVVDESPIACPRLSSAQENRTPTLFTHSLLTSAGPKPLVVLLTAYFATEAPWSWPPLLPPNNLAVLKSCSLQISPYFLGSSFRSPPFFSVYSTHFSSPEQGPGLPHSSPSADLIIHSHCQGGCK